MDVQLLGSCLMSWSVELALVQSYGWRIKETCYVGSVMEAAAGCTDTRSRRAGQLARRALTMH
jgi:hypothetical protein